MAAAAAARQAACAAVRRTALSLYVEGEEEEGAGDFAAAVRKYEGTLTALRAAGPPAEGDDSEGTHLTLCTVFNALGLAYKRLGNLTGAARCYDAALDSCAAWPGPPVPPGDETPAMVACANLCTLLGDSGERAKAQARVRQLRSLLERAGVGVPSDTAAYLRYALTALRWAPSEVDAGELLAAARRMYPWPDSSLGPFLRAAGAAKAEARDFAGALALLQEAVALARANPDAVNATFAQAHSLSELARLHLSYSTASPAAVKTAALRAYASAAECFTTPEAQQCEQFADILHRMCLVSWDPVAQGVGEVRVTVRGGGAAREVSLHELNGWGRIALYEESVRIRTALYAEDSLRLLPALSELSRICHHHRDMLGARDAAASAAALASSQLRPGNGALSEALACASSAATNLENVLKRVRTPGGGAPGALSRQQVQRAALALYAQSGIQTPTRNAPGERQRTAQVNAATARTAARREVPCAGCGAVKPAAAPAFKLCSTCQAVSYCSRECQKTHWKTHKRECAALAGAAAGAAGGSAD